MDDVVHPVFGEPLRHRRPVGKVEKLEGEALNRAELFETGLLQIDIIVVVEIVDTVNFEPVSQQPGREMESDKASRSCYQYLHTQHRSSSTHCKPAGSPAPSNRFTACSTGERSGPG